MEGFFAAIEFLADHPAIAALIEVATLAVILVGGPLVLRAIRSVAKDARDGRRKLHERIDETADELGKKIEKIAEDQRAHEMRDERELAEISTALKFLVGKNGGDPGIVGGRQ